MITRENKIIRLSWAKADLFQTICTETAYNARTLADDKGLPLFDRYAITADERAFFDQHIAEALTTLSHHFRRIVPDSQPMAVEGDLRPYVHGTSGGRRTGAIRTIRARRSRP